MILLQRDQKQMFNKNDASAYQKKIRVLITLRNGERHPMAVLCAAHKNLRDVITDESAFLEVEGQQSASGFLLKADIHRIEPEAKAEAPSTVSPLRGAGEDTRFDAEDPYIVLGVPRHITEDALKHIYYDLARAYHPDKFCGAGLPDDIVRFGSRILARINAAYDAIMLERQHKKAS
jgi:DnaJ-domain-containing protein 1